MRADVNISLREPGGEFGGKVEIKNLNSFRAVQRSIDHEIERQREIIARGERVPQETRGWSEREEITVAQRTKEYAHDYRYFPEPDLPPLLLNAAYVSSIEERLPELPAQLVERLQRQYGLSGATARVLAGNRALAQYYEDSVAAADGVPPGTVANWTTGDVSRLWNERAAESDAFPVPARELARLLTMVAAGEVSGSAAKSALETMYGTGESAEAVVDRLDLRQIQDESALEGVVSDVIAGNEKLVQTYLSGKANVLQALVGQVMKASGGKANPQRAKELLLDKLSG
jgi:aspartyl-tRNA(Asn)/glutamyl-tRNA(Gln) amidotransferase subunit B